MVSIMERPASLDGAVSLESETRATLKKETGFPVYIKDPNPDPITDLESDPNELSIFDAQKYFNGSVVTIQKPTRRFGAGFGLDKIPERDCLRISSASASSVDAYGGRRVSHATTTFSSEVSWNSQGELVTKPSAVIPAPASKPPKKRRGGRRWIFGQKCPCYGRSSTLAEEDLDDPKPNNVSTPPWPERRKVVVVPRQKVAHRGPRDTPRESLEVFHPAYVREEDIASDASSDLFEIESFSTQSNYPNMEEGRRVGSYSEAPSVYEPSEVSIDWSVVTASGATHLLAMESEIIRGEDEKRCGALLGCDCGKAMRLVRWGAEEGQHVARRRSFKEAQSNSSTISIPYSI